MIFSYVALPLTGGPRPLATVGFDSGDSVTALTLPGSFTAAVNSTIMGGSNVGVPGVWAYRVDTTVGGNVRVGPLSIFEACPTVTPSPSVTPTPFLSPLPSLSPRLAPLPASALYPFGLGDAVMQQDDDGAIPLCFLFPVPVWGVPLTAIWVSNNGILMLSDID